MFSHLRLGFARGLLPIGLSVKIMEAPLRFLILATFLANLNLLDLFTLNT